MREVFDPIRKTWVAATPEEIVRQTWIERMVGQLKFPRELLAVEKELSGLPTLPSDLPSRRIDLLCFMKKQDEMRPLLLIECKQGALTEEALSQVMSYNHYIQAPYLAIVNQREVRFRSSLGEISRLPSYLELVEGL